MTRCRILPASAAALAALFASVAFAQHAGDVWVGRTSDDTLTTGGFPYAEQAAVLDPVDGLLKGWADNSPGFDHVTQPVPADDLYPLESGADIWLEIVALDPAFRVIDASFQVLDQPGERTRLGDAALHTHPTWHIDSQSPNFDPLRTLWRAQLRLEDDGSTGYRPREILMMFSNVECLSGDVNGDGSVNRGDVFPFWDVVVGPAQATARERCAADANLDGLVTAADVDAFLALLLAETGPRQLQPSPPASPPERVSPRAP